MMLATMGMCLATMVGPLDEAPVVRISRPGSEPEFVRQVAVGVRQSGGGIVVPSSSVGGGGEATVVGAAEAVVSDGSYIEDEMLGLQTDQVFRAFGYDRGTFGYTTIHYPGNRWGGHGGGWGGHPRPRVDPRLQNVLRDLAPIESRFPPVPGR